MSRKLTHYRQPSITERLATAATIEELRELRDALAVLFAAGRMQPTEKTHREWNVQLWARVLELMRADPTCACHIYNVTLRWPKPEALARDMERQLKLLIAPLPSPAARLREQGITIVGITD